MKKLFVNMVCLTLLISAYAQGDRVVIKSVDYGEVPEKVIASIEEDFPNAVVDEIAILTHEHFSEDWVINEEEKASDFTDQQYYAIEFYGDKIKGKAVYNADGEMVKFKETITDTALPPAIRTYLGENYPDWVVIKDKEVIKKSPYGEADLYQVTLKKGKEKKELYFDGEAHTLTK